MKICIGIVSWFPEEEEHRRGRINRFNKTLMELDKAFKDRVDYLIVAQNWKDYQLPTNINKKCQVFKYDKLGILNARKILRKHFLESEYEYLIMSDDDVMMKYKDQTIIDNYIKALEANPEGFMFLKYGWSLNLCAISRWIYEREDMIDVDPEKGEGYEDTTFPNLLHYKYPEHEFKVNDIEFLQHKRENRRGLKSTWENTSTNHTMLRKRSEYIINGFKNGNFNIQKLKEEAMQYAENKYSINVIYRKTILNTKATFTGLPEEYWKDNF